MAAVGTFVAATGLSYIVAGNVRLAAGIVTVEGGVNSVIPTGFNHIYSVSWNVKSAVSNGFIKGFLFASQSSLTAPTVTSGDDFYVTILGV